jgi:hypothetical protein
MTALGVTLTTILHDGALDGPLEVDATIEPAKIAPRTKACPRCGSHEIARIQYGMPAVSKRLEGDLAAHRVVLGGCMVWDHQPDRSCSACVLEFRADGVAPVLDPTL